MQPQNVLLPSCSQVCQFSGLQTSPETEHMQGHLKSDVSFGLLFAAITFWENGQHNRQVSYTAIRHSQFTSTLRKKKCILKDICILFMNRDQEKVQFTIPLFLLWVHLRDPLTHIDSI
jgi:hypothetical protein